MAVFDLSMTARKPSHPVSLYRDVTQKILDYIDEQKIPFDGRLPSERKFMSLWNVSQPTVNKAIACLIAMGQLRREGYRLYVAVNELKAPSEQPIHALCPHAEYQHTVLIRHDLVEAAHDTAVLFGGQVIAILAKTPVEQRQQVLNLLRQGTAGFLIWPIKKTPLEDLFVECDQKGIPFVVCDTDFGKFDYVGVDNEIGVRITVVHLLALGHRQIAYITDHLANTPPLQSLRRRLDAYRQCCLSSDLKASAKRVIEVTSMSEQECAQAVETLFNRYPEVTAVFCSNDRIALYAMQYAASRGITVPADLSFVGFDNIDAASNSSPPLTTISQGFYNIGLAATELLYRRMRSRNSDRKSAQRLRLEPSLIVRDSTTAPRSGPLKLPR